MCVCIHAFIDVLYMDLYMYLWIFICMYSMYLGTYVCMDVYGCVYIYV